MLRRRWAVIYVVRAPTSRVLLIPLLQLEARSKQISGNHAAQALGRNLRVPRVPQAQKGAAGDGVFMRLMALPKGRGMLTRALRILYAPPSLWEAVPGACLLCLPVCALPRMISMPQ